MGLEQITVLILTRNEAANIGRTLDRLSWAPNVLVIDSFSDDGTLGLLQGRDGVRVLQREFTSHAEQWNFGLGEVATEWTLAIDADYILPENAAEALETAVNGVLPGHWVEFRYCICGRPVKGGILPPRLVLFRTGSARYRQDGHTQRLDVPGETGVLPFRIDHDDRKPLSRWLESQIGYARLEAEKIGRSAYHDLGFNDRIRKTIVLAPVFVFVLVYILRGGFLSGWRGLFYALQRATAELLLSLFLIDAKLRRPMESAET